MLINYKLENIFLVEKFGRLKIDDQFTITISKMSPQLAIPNVVHWDLHSISFVGFLQMLHDLSSIMRKTANKFSLFVENGTVKVIKKRATGNFSVLKKTE